MALETPSSSLSALRMNLLCEGGGFSQADKCKPTGLAWGMSELGRAAHVCSGCFREWFDTVVEETEPV